MATDIVGSLFGVTPEGLDAARQQQMREQAMAYAQLTPQQQITYGAALGGQQFGRSIGGLLGAEDPQMKLVQLRSNIMQGTDPTNIASLTQAIQRLQSAGDTVGALSLTNTLRNLQQITSTTEARQAEAALRQGQLQKLQMQNEQENQLQMNLAKLPENATEEQIQAVLRRYGDPKTVLSAIERKQTVQMQADERRKLEEDRQRFKQEQMDKDQEFQRQMAYLRADLKGSTNALQQQLIQEKIDALRQKKQDAIDKQLSSAEGIVQNTDVVLGKIKEADKLIGGMTTGMGSYLSIVPGSNAKELATTLATIKARLGFDQLAQMRQASPTGGALGNVSNKELASLESAVASLDQSLSPKALRENLKQINDSYSRWRDAALAKIPADRQQTASPAMGTAQNPIKLK
jgi:hypothetical protein